MLFRVLISFVLISVISIDTINASSNTAGMRGGKHDFSSTGSSLSLCSYCHLKSTPPDGSVAQWNTTVTNTAYEPYSSPTMDATMTRPGIMSLMCLSCHDGVTASNSLSGSLGTLANNMTTVSPGSSAFIGTSLSDDHPVGVSIDMDFMGIKDELTISSVGLKVYDGKVECSSCHDVHGRDGHANFLRLDPTGPTSMCQGCHNK